MKQNPLSVLQAKKIYFYITIYYHCHNLTYFNNKADLTKKVPLAVEMINFTIGLLMFQNRFLNSAHSISDTKRLWKNSTKYMSIISFFSWRFLACSLTKIWNLSKGVAVFFSTTFLQGTSLLQTVTWQILFGPWGRHKQISPMANFVGCQLK